MLYLLLICKDSDFFEINHTECLCYLKTKASSIFLKTGKNKKIGFFRQMICQLKNLHYLCTAFRAQMAESVDALVSNTSGVTPVPVRPRLWVRV